jgi:hypothetical protein
MPVIAGKDLPALEQFLKQLKQIDPPFIRRPVATVILLRSRQNIQFNQGRFLLELFHLIFISPNLAKGDGPGAATK